MACSVNCVCRLVPDFVLAAKLMPAATRRAWGSLHAMGRCGVKGCKNICRMVCLAQWLVLLSVVKRAVLLSGKARSARPDGSFCRPVCAVWPVRMHVCAICVRYFQIAGQWLLQSLIDRIVSANCCSAGLFIVCSQCCRAVLPLSSPVFCKFAEIRRPCPPIATAHQW